MSDGDASSGWEWFVDRICAITQETTCETSVKPNRLGEVSSGTPRLVEAECWRAIIGLVDGVIEDDGVRTVVSAYSNTAHSFSLAFGSGFTVVAVVVEETNREKIKPS